jgi:hypothetical protein
MAFIAAETDNANGLPQDPLKTSKGTEFEQPRDD